jgi:uncharacterized protein (DUF58 family)
MRVSREGKRFFLAALLTGIAAFNTGNNLIYLIFCMMLAIIAISIIILRINMRGLQLKVFQSGPLFAKTPANLEVSVSNEKSRIPSYSIKVLMPEKISGKAYFPKILPGSDVSESISVVFRRRGVYGYGEFLIESSFPFIFFSKRILCSIPSQVVVYPEIKETEKIVQEIMKDGSSPDILWAGKGDEFSLIREFRDGDDRRRIHWKASAKTSTLMVTEYAAEEARKLTVILDNLMPRDHTAFENSVSFAASVSDRFLNEGCYVRLLTCRKVIPFGSGKDQLYKILDVLAAISPQNSWECPFSAETAPEGFVILILNSGDSPLNRFAPVSDMVIYAADL